MSSFFTTPASQRKRKRTDERPGKPAKRRELPAENGRRSRGIEKQVRSAPERDESISGSGSEDEDFIEPESGAESEATSEEDETAPDRRVRLAQRYLDNIKEEIDEIGFDAADIDKDLIAQRLKQDVDEAKGRQFRLIAKSLDIENATHCAFRADTQSTTAVAVFPPYAYTVSKDKTLIKWKIIPPAPSLFTQLNGKAKRPSPPRLRPKQLAYVRGVRIDASDTQQQGHNSPILSLAASPNGEYLATGDATSNLIIWSASTLRPLKTFTSHRDAVTSLAFAPNSAGGGAQQLFSASHDRTLKTYSLNSHDSLAYVETLFGHQDHVLGVAVLSTDECVSVGARERTARLWKVVEETQLVFRADSNPRKDAHVTGSVECVAALPPTHFVTGSDAGAISLWHVSRKKPLCTVEAAHGVEQPPRMEDVTSERDADIVQQRKLRDTRRAVPRAICSLASVPGTDVVLSGSWDGCVRLWKVADDKRSLEPLGVLGGSGGAREAEGETEGQQSQEQQHVKGFVNSIAVFERRREVRSEFGGTKEGESLGLCVVAGTGKEPRCGRWRKLSDGARNGAVVFEVSLKESSGE